MRGIQGTRVPAAKQPITALSDGRARRVLCPSRVEGSGSTCYREGDILSVGMAQKREKTLIIRTLRKHNMYW